MTDTQNRPINGFFDSAAIIGLFTLLGYSMAIAYQSGYNSYFGIPSFFVPLDTTHVLLGIFFGLSAVLIFFVLWNFLFIVGLYEKKDAFSKSLRTYISICIFLVVSWFFNPPQTLTSWLVNLGILVWLGIAEFGLPALFQKGKGSYKEKLEAQWKMEIENQKKGIFDKLFQYTGLWPVTLLLFGLVTMNFSYAVGSFEARTTKVFQVVSTEPEMVILQSYGDYLLARTASTTDHILGSELRILRLEDIATDGYTFTSKNLGELKLSTPTN